MKVSGYPGVKVNVGNAGGKVIWINFVCMVAGFIIIFLFSHQRVWAKVEENENGCFIILAGSATINLQGLEQLFNTIQNDLYTV